MSVCTTTVVNKKKVKTCHDELKVTESDGSIVNYTPNTLNQYTNTVTNPTKPSEKTQTFTYDANGNLINDGVNTYGYDYKNRLVEARSIKSGKVIESFVYDPLGRRVSRVV